MANRCWIETWSNPQTAEDLQKPQLWLFYDNLKRPYQFAIEVIDAMVELGDFASYEQIAKKAGLGTGSPGTVSQCINCLAKAGYPFVFSQDRKVKLEKRSQTKRARQNHREENIQHG